MSIYELGNDGEKCALEPYVHQNQMYCVKGKSLNNLLDKLKERGHFKTMKIIGKLVLVVRPDLFEICYKPKRPQGTDVESVMDIQSLLSSTDSLGLTLLHRAAFYGDTEVIKQIIKKSNRNLEGQQALLNCIVGGNGGNGLSLTPLFVASIRGHENVCSQLLTLFQKEQISTFRDSLLEAGLFLNVEPLKLICSRAKKILGESFFIKLFEWDYKHEVLVTRFNV